MSRLGIYGAFVCVSPRAGHKGLMSRSHCSRLLIPIPVVISCLQPPRACRLLVESRDKVSPGILQLLLAPRCRSGERCLRERWLLIGSRPSPTCFQTSNIFTTSTQSTPKCWLLIGCYNSSQSEASILVSIWVLFLLFFTLLLLFFQLTLTSWSGTSIIHVLVGCLCSWLIGLQSKQIF